VQWVIAQMSDLFSEIYKSFLFGGFGIRGEIINIKELGNDEFFVFPRVFYESEIYIQFQTVLGTHDENRKSMCLY